MTTLKVKELIDVLSPNEVRSFRLYLKSPLYNSSESLSNLFELLLGTESISKNVLFVRMFGEVPYNDKKMRYLFSDLTSHLEKFLSLLEFEKDSEEESLYRQKSLSERNVKKAYSFTMIKSSAKENSEKARSFMNKYRSEEIAHLFNARQHSRLAQLNYTGLLKSLDQFYFVRKLQLQCELINLKNVLNKQFEVILIDPICEYLVSNSFLSSPLIEVYYYILISLKGNKEESFDAYEKIISITNEFRNKLAVEDLNNIYQYAKNFCIRRINSGEDNFRLILFDLYKSILKNKRLMKHDHLSPWEFKNIVTLGLRLKEDEWVKDFISRFINFLPPHERKNALTYNTAMLYYFKKNYKFVLKYLQEVEFTDLYYQLDSKSILLKVYFENDEQEALLHHIAAFKIFLLRNKNISAYQLSIYKNFIKYSLKIFRAGSNSKKLEALRLEISSAANISDRSWLTERINELV